MNKQEALKRIEAQKETLIRLTGWAVYVYIEELIKSIDEPEKGHADEAPRYVKNILARLRALPLHDREVWLKVIMSEFKHDFSRAIYNEGFEEGKRAGLNEHKKVIVPQFVADWYEEHKDDFEYGIWEYILDWDKQPKSEFHEWMNYADNKPMQTLVNMLQFGYEVEKELKYIVKMKNHKFSSRRLLAFGEISGEWFFTESGYGNVITKFTRKQLEEAGFGWVFDCPGIEIEEVE